jgi:hypothetical protein
MNRPFSTGLRIYPNRVEIERNGQSHQNNGYRDGGSRVILAGLF